MKKIIVYCSLFIVFLLSTVYYLPSTIFASNHVCCSLWTTRDGNRCINEEGTDIGEVMTCPSDQICDPVTDPPKCKKTAESVFGQIPLPGPIANIPGLTGAAKLSSVLSTGIVLLYIFGSIAFVFMIVWAAIRWITSGGDKEAVASARKRITWAIIGLTLLSLAFVIIGVIGNITGFSLFRGNELIPGQQDQEIERQKRFETVQKELSKDANLCTGKQIIDCNSVNKICVIEGGKVECKTEKEICKDGIDDCREAKRECYVENGKPVCKGYADICTQDAIEDCQSRRPPYACVNNNGQPRCVLVP